MAALVPILLLGCRAVRFAATQYPHPDLAALYGDAVRNLERNPVILIPGFAGSRLVRSQDGRPVWGELFTGSALGYGTPEGLTALALDLAALPEEPTHADLAQVPDDAVATAALDRVKADIVITDLNISVYGELMELLGEAGYLEHHPGRLAYDPGLPQAFSFFYDWRQDCAGNAAIFGDFLRRAGERVRVARRQRGLPEKEIRFDVVAHSLGGLLARYYLRYGAEDVLGRPEAEITWSGAEAIDRLVVVSTPSFGSMKVLRDLIHGRTHPVLPTLRASLAASMVAFYQMLPRPHHPLWIRDGTATSFDYTDLALWTENGWGPFSEEEAPTLAALFPADDAARRRRRMAAFMAAAFERARRLAEALDRHPETPPPTRLILFAGDADPTLERALLRRQEGSLRMSFEEAGRYGLTGAGDGTVTRASALADERIGRLKTVWLGSPIPWDQTTFLSDRHATFLRNPTFQNNLLHLLLERPPSGLRASP